MRTAAVALLLSVAVGGWGFTLEAAGLRPAAVANAAAARAAGWLLGASYVASRIHADADAGAVSGICVDNRYLVDGRLVVGSALSLSDGGSVRTVSSHGLVARNSFTKLPENALLIAGCPQVLGPRIASLAQFATNVQLRPAWLSGTRVTAIRFPHIVLFVAPHSDRPLGVALHGIWSRLILDRPIWTAGQDVAKE